MNALRRELPAVTLYRDTESGRIACSPCWSAHFGPNPRRWADRITRPNPLQHCHWCNAPGVPDAPAPDHAEHLERVSAKRSYVLAWERDVKNGRALPAAGDLFDHEEA